jgi:predicted nucleotidyltransferase
MYGSVAWGDYDSDGDLDILLTGEADWPHLYESRVYRNDGGAFSDIGAGLPGVEYGSAAWGDYDNDGDLDILLSGYLPGRISRIYRNDGGTFSDIDAGLPGVSEGSVAWGDYDSDGDLDILLTGFGTDGRISCVYDSYGLEANTPPSAPSDLSTQLTDTEVTFSWDASLDTQTPSAGLSYNLRIGTTPGGSEICSAMADAGIGHRYVPQLGNAQMRTSWTLELPTRAVYYWSVQAVDGAFAGSPFAPEEVLGTGAGVDELPIPTRFALRANVPNPFNPATAIRFSLPRTEYVKLLIYDAVGRRVRILLDDERPAGLLEVLWDGLDDRGSEVASGVYICRMQAGPFTESKLLTVLR